MSKYYRQMPKANDPIVVGEGNEQILQLANDLRLFGFPNVSSDLMANCGCDLNKVALSIISYRVTNYVERPNPSTKSIRRGKTIDKWIATEQRVKNTSYMDCASVLIGSKMRLIGDTAYRYLTKPESINIEFSPGESFNSQRGSISLPRKLDPQTHSVSISNRDLWVSLIVHVRGLYKPYLEHWLRVVRPTLNLPLGWSTRITKAAIINGVIDSIPDYVVMGTRQSFVDKDNEIDRPIEINPFGDIVLQKIVGWGLRRAIFDVTGINLDNAQQHHQKLISSNLVSTLDLSSASDSIVAHHVRAGFSKKFADIVLQLSAEYILCKHDGVESYHRQNKLCSMGNGFTFELLTTICYSIANKYSPELSYAYGDDIIVHRMNSNLVAQMLVKCGFVINHKKSFLYSPIKESCGAFYVSGVGYVETYKLTWSDNIVELIANVNKLRRMICYIEENLGVPSVLDVMKKYHNELLALIPAWYHGPTRCGDLAVWVENPNYVKRHKKSSLMREARCIALSEMTLLEDNFQLSLNHMSCILIPYVRPKIDIAPKRVVSWQPLVYAYIYAGRRSRFEIKQRHPSIALKEVIVHDDGFALS